jgi:hypothetical protein
MLPESDIGIPAAFSVRLNEEKLEMVSIPGIMGMTYYHWSADPVRLRKMSYLQSGDPKPNGFWFDANGEWKRWCEAVQFRLGNFRYRHTVTILDTSRILFLKTARDIDAFTRKYGRNLSGHIQLLQSSKDVDVFARKYGRDLFGEIQRQFSNYIMWDEVAGKHSGIVIFPYFRSRSLTYLWYYGWNCAGGCVWDTSVIRLGKPCRVAE